MSEYLEFALEPGVSVRLRTYPAPAPAGQPPAGPAGEHDDADDELPDGYGGAVPVARPTVRGIVQQSAELSRDALRLALSPLRPLLQEVHDTLVAVPDRPQEISVEFGVQLGSDLKLGIVGGSAEASLTVSATWRLPDPPAAPTAPPGGDPAP